MDKKKITGEYIAGFVDGEGCFSLTLRKDKGKYLYWKSGFSILLRDDDVNILTRIRNYFNCGGISYTRSFVRYQISNNDDLVKVIIPFFDKFKLIGKKRNDFELWKEAVLIIDKNKMKKINVSIGKKGFTWNHWNTDDINRLKVIRNKMLKYKSGSLRRNFKY
ncbi:MAG: LAGLIDADG family homing endonuclease [Candidatus Moranbacteria bacterium]|nr:LAGLIDADG family homing endonuclease [Candidatus Moranbacteria bacterium]